MMPSNNKGFTLVEIIVAIAIIGTALLVLLDSHYAALDLFNNTREEVMMQNFVERAMGEAEVQVLSGQLSGSGDFGKKFPDYSYSFTAQISGEQYIPIYGLNVSVQGPLETKEVQMLVYSMTTYQ
jgi:prepilin-type N-terminal cleavage/methylation domain-containing protein